MKQAQKNFWTGVANEGLWGLGFGFLVPATILSQAVVDLGGAASAAGLMAGLVFTGFNLPQVFSALALPPRFTDPKALAWLHVPAILGPLVAGLGLLLTRELPPGTRLLVLYCGFALFSLGVGLVVAQWVACVGRCIPRDFRGRYFGACFCASGLAQAASGWLGARWILKGGLDWGYALCFLLAVPCLSLSMVVMARLKPLAPRPAPPPPGALRSAFTLMTGRLLTPGVFRAGLALALLLTFLNAPGSLFTVYLRKVAVVDPSWFEAFTPALPLGGMAGALWLGHLLDHRGPRTAFATAILPGMAALGLVLIAGHWFYPVLAFAASGFMGAAFPVLTMALVLNQAKPGESTVHVGLFNTLMSPWIFLAPLASGFLADRAGYAWVFGLAAACGLAALFLLVGSGDLDGRKNKIRN